MPPWLPIADLLALHALVVHAHLTLPERRGLLLRFLDSAFAATLPVLPVPHDQLLSDLKSLNDAVPLADGTIPLRVWLEIAIALTRPSNQHRAFEAALAHLPGGATPPPNAPVHEGTALNRVVVLAAHTEDGMQRVAAQVRALLAELRGQVSGVAVADLADADARTLTATSELRVVLLGASTGGAHGESLIHALLDEPSRLVVACLEPLDRARRRSFAAELPRRDELLEAAENKLDELPQFALNDEVASLRDPILRRLEALRPVPVRDSAVLASWEQRYLDEQASWWRDGRSDGLREMAAGCTLRREPLYVSLHTRTERWRRDPDAQEQAPDAKAPAPLFLDELLSLAAIPHAVVVGEAGTGKTVLLQHIAWSLRCHHRGQALPDECRLDLGELRGERNVVPVPVLLEARNVAAMLDRHGTARVFERLLADAFGLTDPAPEVQEGLRQGRYLLLVDSLDEVPGIAARERVLDALKPLPASSGCRVILTTRPTAHTAVSVPSPYERLDIAPLDEERRQRLVERWRSAENLDAEAARRLPETLAGLDARFPRDGGGQSPLENPLLLTCVLLVFVAQGRLPDNLADLYERMVRHLCDRRPEDAHARTDAQRQNPTWRREVLIRVGAALQGSGTTALSAAQLCEQLVREERFATKYDAQEALDQLAVTTGLFRFEDEGGAQIIRPWHRSFQEYLAACGLAARDRTAENIVRALWRSGVLADPGWEGSLRFAVGVFGMQGSEKARGFIDTLLALAKEPEYLREGRLLGLAAAGVVEYRDEHFREAEPAATLRTRLAERFAARGAAWPWRDRLLALTALGRLPGGDPRLPDPRSFAAGWVRIPAGTYPIGGDPNPLGALARQPATVGTFHVRAWPVTIAEYRAFLIDTGHEAPTLWAHQVHRPNAPVTGVSWHDARAFCRWATTAWQCPEDAPGLFDLPDSAEWEIAARRAYGGLYPWGDAPPGEGDDARANYGWDHESPHAPTPVGMFPTGNAGDLLDMAGNVWEWCASLHGEEQDSPCHLDGVDEREGDERHEGDATGEAPRVLRGGSWTDLSRCLRASYRFGSQPKDRGDFFGFRVVFRSTHTTL